MTQTIGRFLLVAFAFIVSCIVAVILLIMLGGRELANIYLTEFTNNDPTFTPFNEILGPFLFLISIIPSLTILPALIVVIVGEVAQIRSYLYYIISGGIAVLALLFLAGTIDNTQAYTIPSVRFMTIFAASGFVAGFIYWLIAGRNASR